MLFGLAEVDMIPLLTLHYKNKHLRAITSNDYNQKQLFPVADNYRTDVLTVSLFKKPHILVFYVLSIQSLS